MSLLNKRTRMQVRLEEEWYRRKQKKWDDFCKEYCTQQKVEDCYKG